MEQVKILVSLKDYQRSIYKSWHSGADEKKN